MPARVHALIVARSGETGSVLLSRTLDALAAQSLPPAAVTVVVLGDGERVRRMPGIGHLVEGIIEARAGTTFTEAIALARPRVAVKSAVWLLADDTVPEPDALQLLAGALERSPSAAIAAPKLVRHDDSGEIVSLGVSMTRWGRSVELAADELDQGQHDDAEDALGADVRGMLIRGEAPRVLRPDTALSGADVGLDLGIRARLGGARMVLVPRARVAVHPGGPAALPRSPISRAWATRRAQLHRRLTYAPAAAVPLHWLTLLPLALWRSITHLIAKRPAEVAPEWGAALASMLSLAALARSRRALRSFRSASWSDITPLRVTRAQLKQRLDDGHGSERGAVSELNFFSGGGAWAVLAALVVSITAFGTLLAWPVLGGGALLPLRRTVGALWGDAAWGLRDVGLGVVGPADPFAAVVAVLGTLWPAAPSFALVLLWLVALPLAVLGGWFAATRVTDRAGLRILGGVLWAFAPTFLTALVQGRPAAVLLHLVLPWLVHTAVVAHRSWGAAGAASVLTAVALACAPSLAPAFALLWAVSIVLMLATRRLRGASRLLWLLIPSAVMFAPLVIRRVRTGDPWALLADPGAVAALEQAGSDAAGRAEIAMGFPAPGRAGWDWLAGAAVADWVPLLLAPVAVLALLSALSPRWRAGFALLLTALSGLATALFAAGVVVSFADGVGVAVWPGTGISLAWLGLTGAALVTLDSVVAHATLRVSAGLVAGLAVSVCGVPAMVSVHADHALLQNGPTSTLPALVAAQAGDEGERGTLVLTPLNDGSLSADTVWGASATLGAQSTLLNAATRPQGEDISTTAVDLVSGRDFDAAAALADDAITFVLLAPVSEEKDRARTMRDEATTAIDQRAGFVKAGETARGMLWRVDTATAPREQPSLADQTISRAVVLGQLIVLLAALLLAIPTRASRRAARARARIVGRQSDAPRPSPREKAERHAEPASASHPGPAPEPVPESADEPDVVDSPDAERSHDLQDSDVLQDSDSPQDSDDPQVSDDPQDSGGRAGDVVTRGDDVTEEAR